MLAGLDVSVGRALPVEGKVVGSEPDPILHTIFMSIVRERWEACQSNLRVTKS